MSDPTAPQPDDELPVASPEHDTVVPALEDNPDEDEAQPKPEPDLAQDDELRSGQWTG